MNTHYLIQQVVPEIIELFEKRYTILRTVYSHQPLGRRTLAALLNIGERIVRSETVVLKDSGLIDIKPAGMTVTPEGEAVLEGLREFSNELKGFDGLEHQVADILGIDRVIIVPGNLDQEPSVLSIIGKAAAVLLSDILSIHSTVAVTGGSSVYAVANALGNLYSTSQIVVIPARGGIGKEVEYQSNTLAAMFARKLGGHYRLLHLPDHLTTEAAQTLLDDPDTRSVIDQIKVADVLICGIGRAQDMATKKNLSVEQITGLKAAGAVAEAFGYYFDRQGEIILTTNTIGLHLNDLKKIPHVLGVAGGKQKAEAIVAVLTGWSNSTLITDEAAALEIVNSIGGSIL